MTWSVRFARAALVGGGLLGFACGDSTGPVLPKALAAVEPRAVQATGMGLQPVSFNVAASWVEACTLGATVSAALATTDCRANGFYTDVYSLDLTSGQQSISLAMGSTAFNSW